MPEKSLEEKIYRELWHCGGLDAAQLSVRVGYPLSASEEMDNTFFGALRNLEVKKRIHWKPASSERLEADDSSPYCGKIYLPGIPLTQTLREAYVKVTTKLKQYF